MVKKYKIIGVVADHTSKRAREAHDQLVNMYNFVPEKDIDSTHCDLIIALGGDGLMLKVLHRYMERDIPIFGLNRGSVGFLLNEFSSEDLLERISKAVPYKIHPLEMHVETVAGEKRCALAVNEVSLLRQTNQAARLRIDIDGQSRIETLVCDGILVSTPAGSTAYNFAANGPIIPMGSNILALTPISPFRPRRWRGALLSHRNMITFTVLDPKKRPVSAVADFHEVRDIAKVEIHERRDISLTLLFDKESNIQDRIIMEQFIP